MRYILATLKLLLGIVEAICDWICYLPFALFTIPVRRWNETLYGKQLKTAVFKIKDLKNGKVEITLPNGEVVYADKKESK